MIILNDKKACKPFAGVKVGFNFPVFCPSFKAYRSYTETFFHAEEVGLQAYDLRMLQDAVGHHLVYMLYAILLE